MPKFQFRKLYRYVEDVVVEAATREEAEKLVDSSEGNGERFDAYLDAEFVRALPDDSREDEDDEE